MRALSSRPSHLPKAPPPATITVGIGFQEGNLGDTHTQAAAVTEASPQRLAKQVQDTAMFPAQKDGAVWVTAHLSVCLQQEVRCHWTSVLRTRMLWLPLALAEP